MPHVITMYAPTSSTIRTCILILFQFLKDFLQFPPLVLRQKRNRKKRKINTLILKHTHTILCLNRPSALTIPLGNVPNWNEMKNEQPLNKCFIWKIRKKKSVSTCMLTLDLQHTLDFRCEFYVIPVPSYKNNRHFWVSSKEKKTVAEIQSTLRQRIHFYGELVLPRSKQSSRDWFFWHVAMAKWKNLPFLQVIQSTKTIIRLFIRYEK